MKAKRVSYAGKRVYIGIDVHREFFVSSCVSEGQVVKSCRLPARSAAVIMMIKKYFRRAEIRSCYEAGYSGFWLHRELIASSEYSILTYFTVLVCKDKIAHCANLT